MKIPNVRRKFSHPGIEVDIARLREIISAGDVADVGLHAENNRILAEVAHGRLDAGHLGQLREQLLAKQGELLRWEDADSRRNADVISRIKAAIARLQDEIKAETARIEIAKAPHRVAAALRDRCVDYAIEAGVRLPDLARFDRSQWSTTTGEIR
ncbi:hypothetical protein [Paracoccus aminophilus]|nr:hypothetical protein [Paracoccus aminophilus]